jgi:hypothetical protein
MRGVVIPLLALPLLAQAPAKGSKAFFLQDPKVVMAACAEESMALEKDRDHGETNAEWGRAFLAAGQREKAEALFSRARPMLNAPYHSRLEASGWLRTGHRGEGLALLHSAPFAHATAGTLFMAAQELLRAGLPIHADDLVLKAYELEPREGEQLLACAQVAAEYGALELAVKYAGLGVKATSGQALPLALAARVTSEALHPLPGRIQRAPWASGLERPSAPAPRRIFLLSRFPVHFGPQSTFPYGTGETRFNKAVPNRDQFLQDWATDMAKALPGARSMAPEGAVTDLQALLPSMGTLMGPEDRLVAIEELYMGMDEVSRSTTSAGFLLTRIRLVALDRTGARLRSHTHSIITKVNEGEEALSFARKELKGFLEGPGFSHWIE